MNTLEILDKGLKSIEMLFVEDDDIAREQYTSISSLIHDFYPIINHSDLCVGNKEAYKTIFLATRDLYTKLYKESICNPYYVIEKRNTEKILNMEYDDVVLPDKILAVYDDGNVEELEVGIYFNERLEKYINSMLGRLYLNKVKMMFEAIEENPDKEFSLSLIDDKVFIYKEKYEPVCNIMNFSKDLIKYYID